MRKTHARATRRCFASGNVKSSSGEREEALEKMAEFRPAVVLADVDYLGMDGLELIRRILEENRNIPVITITGRGSEDRVAQAIEAGAFWYIEKPLKAPVLRALLDRALACTTIAARWPPSPANCGKWTAGRPGRIVRPDEESCAKSKWRRLRRRRCLSPGKLGRAKKWWHEPFTSSRNGPTDHSSLLTARRFLNH